MMSSRAGESRRWLMVVWCWWVEPLAFGGFPGEFRACWSGAFVLFYSGLVFYLVFFVVCWNEGS